MGKWVLIFCFLLLLFVPLKFIGFLPVSSVNFLVEFQGKQYNGADIKILSCQKNFSESLEANTKQYVSETKDVINNCYWYVDNIKSDDYAIYKMLNQMTRPCSVAVNGVCKTNAVIGSFERYHQTYFVPDKYRIHVVDYTNDIHWTSEPIIKKTVNEQILVKMSDTKNIQLVNSESFYGGLYIGNFFFGILILLIAKIIIILYFSSKYHPLNKINPEDRLDQIGLKIDIEENNNRKIGLILTTLVLGILFMGIYWFVLPVMLHPKFFVLVFVFGTFLFEIPLLYFFNRKRISWWQALELVLLPYILLTVIGFVPYSRWRHY